MVLASERGTMCSSLPAGIYIELDGLTCGIHLLEELPYKEKVITY